ncbi:MAG: DUF4978 domain-containing protein [Paludibacter sp.]|nr:DUF4978 domain-containing protein [Paludibacter sp.]
MKTTRFCMLFLLLFSIKIFSQQEIPFMPLKTMSEGVIVSDLTGFVPTTSDYSLEVQGVAQSTIRIAFSGIEYTPISNTKIRFVQKNNKMYVFEDGTFKVVLDVNPKYSVEGDNLIQNPGFEEVESVQLAAGRWKPTIWDTWNGGMPTWGGDVGKTNVREDANYRSEGLKSIIMHSETRELLQVLSKNALTGGDHYLLSYDYWTSSGAGNGGSTYQVVLRNSQITGDFQSFVAHTTDVTGIAKGSFSTIFQANSTLPQDIWFVIRRNESKVDWLDNFKLFRLIPEAKGISGVNSAVYLPGYAYAPENLQFENGDFIDMTGKLVSPGFENALNGWNVTAPGGKISTSEKAGGLIPANQNHLQFWVGSGGITGYLSQKVTALPNGKYLLQATAVPGFSGSVKLFANQGTTNIVSGSNKVYQVVGYVFDGQLELGLDIQTTGSPTLDIDDFRLFYTGIDAEGYLLLLDSKIQRAKSDTLAIVSASSSLPGYNNLQQYRDALRLAEERVNDDAQTLIQILNALNDAIVEYEGILAAYKPLDIAIKQLENTVSVSYYPVLTEFQTEIANAKAIFSSSSDMRSVIATTISNLVAKEMVLKRYEELKSTIADAQNYLNLTQFSGATIYAQQIATAQAVIDQPVGKDLAFTIKNLRIAKTTYYNSQYTIQPTRKVVSWVDTSLNGSEKFVLRVDGVPTYMSNIQVRLDKLYGYHGWSDTALEAVIKRAADDGFSTVSIPIHWREVEPVKDEFDWTILEKYLGWCKKYDIKMELLWFSWSSGGRVQFLMNYGGVYNTRTPDYVCSLDGKSEFNMLRKTWEYTLDWRDTKLRDRETYVLSKIMDQVALWDANNGNPQTVIGIQLGNEAQGSGDNTASYSEIIDYYHNVGSAVKNSKYVIWTRLNCVSWMTPGTISANEAKRNSGGTNIDFVGIDIYGTNASSIRGNMNGQLPHTGKNYSMIMEIDAKDSSSPLYQIAAIAGGKGFNYYNMGFVDGNDLYTNSGTQLVERGHIGLVRQRNKMISLANQDIALKAHGQSLYIFNYAGNSTATETGLDGISFTPASVNAQAIAIRRNKTELILLSTTAGTFVLPSEYNIAAVSRGYIDKNNIWVKTSDLTISNYTVNMPVATSAVLVKLVPGESDLGIQNPSFENGTANVGGYNVPVSWKLDCTISGADVKLSTATPNHGQYKYNVWASSVTNINLYQDIELKKGSYRLTAVMRTGSQVEVTSQHIFAKVGSSEPVKSPTLIYTTSPYWQILNVEFTVDDAYGTVRVGAASTGTGTSAGWFQIDDFRLETIGSVNSNSDIKAEKSYKIYCVNSGVFIQRLDDTKHVINIYSISGQKVKTIQIQEDNEFILLPKGVYIIDSHKIVVY